MKREHYLAIIELRKCKLLYRRLKAPFQLFQSGLLHSESYYPELPRKNKFTIFWNLMCHAFKYGTVEYHYFSYGLDIKGFRKQKDFLDDSWALWKEYEYNSLRPQVDYTVLLKDKSLFSDLLLAWGFPAPMNLHTPVEQLMDCACEIQKNGEQGNSASFFIKPRDGQCGRGLVQKVSFYYDKIMLNEKDATVNEFKEFLERIDWKKYVAQNYVMQHPLLSSIYGNSINTLRLVTIWDKRNNVVVPLSGCLRVGANGNVVDNWTAGGLAVGIDMSTGKMSKYAFYKYGKGTKTTQHPNTNFVFEDVKVPFFEQALELALRLHERLKPLMIIGWDIAITPQGPLFIEGNDNAELSFMQEANGGLRKDFLQYLY